MFSLAMFWFDSHIHLSSFNNADQKLLITRSQSQNVLGWIMAGYDPQDWDAQLQINIPNTYKSFGLHPWQVLAMSNEQIENGMQTLAARIKQSDFMGETGLDGFRAKTSQQKTQLEEVFVRHLQLNKFHRKPLVLHIVKDHEHAQSLLKTYSFTGMVHGFSGSWEVAKGYIDQGYFISVGRGVYHQGYKSLKEALRKIPLESLLIESDGFSDSKTQPEDPLEIYMKVVHAICEIRNISQEQLQEATFRNINSLLIKEPSLV